MPPTHFTRSSTSPSGHYLLFAESEEVALFRAQGFRGCKIARRLSRAPSTIALRRSGTGVRGMPDYHHFIS